MYYNRFGLRIQNEGDYYTCYDRLQSQMTFERLQNKGGYKTRMAKRGRLVQFLESFLAPAAATKRVRLL